MQAKACTLSFFGALRAEKREFVAVHAFRRALRPEDWTFRADSALPPQRLKKLLKKTFRIEH